MHVRQFYLRESITATQLRECGTSLLAELGRMLVRTWPDIALWLNDTAPEFAADQPAQPFPEYRLQSRERGRLLDPTRDTIYPVSNDVLLTRLILAAIRHSELSLVFVPQHVSRGKLISLQLLAEQYSLQPPDLQKPLRAPWMLDVGSYACDERIVRVFTDESSLQSTITHLLAPLVIEPSPDSGNHVS